MPKTTAPRTAAAKDGRAAVDVEALYPTIGRILRGAGSTVRLGGIVEAPQRFDSSETTTYTWDYGPQQPELRRLYERAKAAQWSAADLPWDTAVDLEAELFELDPAWAAADWFRRMDRREQRRLTVAYNANLISNFIHGEQGALTAAAQLASAVPHMDGKLYASSQVFDEARHVEVFARYAEEKLDELYPCTQNLFNLMQAITVESRWDFKFLGMQLIVEGLAIASFGSLLRRCHEPLLQQLIRQVLRDEARHVAFGVLSLRNFYDDMPPRERRERQEFVYEACLLMRGRLVSAEAYERMGLNPDTVRETFRNSAEVQEFRQLLFAQVVPSLQKVGLIDGWLEERFAEMEVLRFRDYDADAVLDALIDGVDPAAIPAPGARG